MPRGKMCSPEMAKKIVDLLYYDQSTQHCNLGQRGYHGLVPLLEPDDCKVCGKKIPHRRMTLGRITCSRECAKVTDKRKGRNVNNSSQ